MQWLAARQLGVALAESWPALMAALVLGQSGFALGAAWQRARPDPDGRLSCAAAGAAVLLGLACGLAAPAARLSVWTAAEALALAAAMTALGRAHAGRFAEAAAAEPGWAAGASLAGVCAGLLLGGPLAGGAGVNAATAAAGLALLAAARPRAAAALWPALALLLLAAGPAADAGLERLRGAPVDCNYRCSAAVVEKHYRHIHGAWTPFNRLDVWSSPDGRRLVGAYNYRVHWWWLPQPPRKPFWLTPVRPEDRTLILGGSAGLDARWLNAPLSPGRVTVVEIDPGVTGLFAREPELNERVFERVTAVTADARRVLDEDGPPWDAVVVGSMDSPARGAGSAGRTKSGLLTAEGVARVFARLAPGGVALFTPRDELAARATAAALEEAKKPWALLHKRGRPHWYMPPLAAADEDMTEYVFIAAADGRDLGSRIRPWLLPRADPRARAGATVGDIAPDAPAEEKSRPLPQVTNRVMRRERALELWPDLQPALRDDAPYLAGADPTLAHWRGAASGAAAAAALLLLAAAALAGGPGASYFAALGLGHALAQLALTALWRSAFGDPLRTALAVALFWSAGTAAGGLLWRRLEPPRGAAGAAAFALAAAWAAAAGLLAPAAAGPWAALGALAALTLPPALAAGALFPAGLARAPSAARALLWDGLGAACALAVFAGLALSAGHRAALAAALLAYAWALSRRP